MELLLIPVPLFNKHSAVEAYLFRYRLFGENAEQFLDPEYSPLLDALNKGSINALTGGKSLFVPVSTPMLLADLDRQCAQPCNKVVFLIEDPVPPEDAYISNIMFLRAMGYRFALTCYPNRDEPDALLALCSYLVLTSAVTKHSDRRAIQLDYKRRHRNLELMAAGIETSQEYEEAAKTGIELFEGRFYQAPVTKGENKLTPLKVNLVHLLNVVRDENFEFSTIAGIVQRDPALSLSLMRFVNSPFLGVRHRIKTIKHAVTILGQIEMRKWVTAAVFRTLGADLPSELTRLSLVRAKFAENLAALFHMDSERPSLFLMGLFSLLDIVLETPMSKALEIVFVSTDIQNALTDLPGRYTPVMRFMLFYEKAEWTSVLHVIQEYGISVLDVLNAYMDAVAWFNELITDRVRPLREFNR